jgi:hypothetical protein
MVSKADDCLLQDRVYGNKYKCFFDKCRKTFDLVSHLVIHSKIHVSHNNIYTILV